MLVLLTTDPHVEMLGHMFAGLDHARSDFKWHLIWLRIETKAMATHR